MKFNPMKRQTKLIVGLGNPGVEFMNTYHNIGFEVVDALSSKIGNGEFKFDRRFKAEFTENSQLHRVRFGKVILAKPQTYMNLSGLSVKKIKDYFDIKDENILIVHDDVDLKFQTFKLVANSGSAGHRGVQNIQEVLGTKKISRLRVGIKRDKEARKVEHYVLKRFTKSQRSLVQNIVNDCVDVLQMWIIEGLTKTMNVWNGLKGGTS